MDAVKRAQVIAVSSIMAVLLALFCSMLFSPDQAYAAKATLGKAKITSVKNAGDGYVCVKWGKVKKAKKYQLVAAYDKKFKKVYAYGTFKQRKAYITDVENGQRLYIRVRAYNSKKTYGKWSKAKKFTYKEASATNESTATPDANIDAPSGNDGASSGDNNAPQDSKVHEHVYAAGGQYTYYDNEYNRYLSKFNLAAAQYSSKMSYGGPGLYDPWKARNDPTYTTRYNQQLSAYKAELNAIAAERDQYRTQRDYYKGLRDREYYCTICGEKKPASVQTTSLTSAT